MSPLVSWLSWAPFLFFAAVFLGTLLYGLLTAPYELYLEQAGHLDDSESAVAAMQRAAVPRIAFVYPGGFAKEKLRPVPDGILHRIAVQNMSTTTKLDNVVLTLLASIDASGKRREIGRVLEDKAGEKKVTITPEARRFYQLVLARRDKKKLCLAPWGDGHAKDIRDPGSYHLEVEATSDTTRPVVGRYLVSMADNGDVRISLCE